MDNDKHCRTRTQSSDGRAICSGFSHLSYALLRDHLRMPFGRVTSEAAHHRGVDVPRANGVDADILRAVIESRRLRQAITPCFAAAYAGLPLMPMIPAPEDVLTIAPPPCLRISGISCFMHTKTPRRLISRSWSPHREDLLRRRRPCRPASAPTFYPLAAHGETEPVRGRDHLSRRKRCYWRGVGRGQFSTGISSYASGSDGRAEERVGRIDSWHEASAARPTRERWSARMNTVQFCPPPLRGRLQLSRFPDGPQWGDISSSPTTSSR